MNQLLRSLKTLKKSYPFLKAIVDFENVKLFFILGILVIIKRIIQNRKIKENAELEYIIWKYNDETR
jgi:hypothetical protein